MANLAIEWDEEEKDFLPEEAFCKCGGLLEWFDADDAGIRFEKCDTCGLIYKIIN